MLQTALHFSHTLLQEILQPGDHVVMQRWAMATIRFF